MSQKAILRQPTPALWSIGATNQVASIRGMAFYRKIKMLIALTTISNKIAPSYKTSNGDLPICSRFIMAHITILADNLTEFCLMLIIMAAETAKTFISSLMAKMGAIGSPSHLHLRPDIVQVRL
jgi:hypothetical protein